MNIDSVNVVIDICWIVLCVLFFMLGYLFGKRSLSKKILPNKSNRIILSIDPDEINEERAEKIKSVILQLKRQYDDLKKNSNERQK